MPTMHPLSLHTAQVAKERGVYQQVDSGSSMSDKQVIERIREHKSVLPCNWWDRSRVLAREHKSVVASDDEQCCMVHVQLYVPHGCVSIAV